MIKVKHFMKENALLNALYMVSQQSIPRTFLQINIQIDKILFVLFNSKVTFRDMKRRMVKNIH